MVVSSKGTSPSMVTRRLFIVPSGSSLIYSGIGINKLREITNERGCNFVLFVGTKRLIKRWLLDAYLEKTDTL